MQIKGEWGIDNICLAERPETEPGPHDVILSMRAASLNYRDTVIVNRGYGRRSGELPLVPLSDGAGVVTAVGSCVTRFQMGDLACPAFSQTWASGSFDEAAWAGMLGGPLDGVMQESMLVNEAGLAKAPSHMSPSEAATLPCAALTAWNALVGQGGICAGDVVVVQGTGGVSLFALIIAGLHGAETILTSSTEEKLERGRALGATHSINYHDVPEWGRAVRELTDGRGADHVVEVGGAGTLAQSVRAVRPSGTISLIGVLTGNAAELSLGPVVTQNIRLQGITVGSLELFEEMNRAFELHEVRPPVDPDNTFEFEGIADALRGFPEGKHFGKVVCEF